MNHGDKLRKGNIYLVQSFSSNVIKENTFFTEHCNNNNNSPDLAKMSSLTRGLIEVHNVIAFGYILYGPSFRTQNTTTSKSYPITLSLDHISKYLSSKLFVFNLSLIYILSLIFVFNLSLYLYYL